MSLTVANTALKLLPSKKPNHHSRRFPFGVPPDKSKGSKVWTSFQLKPTMTVGVFTKVDVSTTVDGDKTTTGIADDYQSSKKKEFNNFWDKPHVLHPSIAQKSNSSQSISIGFSSFEHGSINIAYRWEDFICVGVDSKLTKRLTGEVASLDYQKFYQLSANIYITMAGSREDWEIMHKYIATELSKKSKKHHTVEAAAVLARMILMIATDAVPDLAGEVGCLVLGWDFTRSHPQMFRVVAGNPLTTSDSAMALGTGAKCINLQDLTDSYHEKLADASRHTMSLLNQACRLDPYCGGTARVWVVQRDRPPFCKEKRSSPNLFHQDHEINWFIANEVGF